MEHEVNRESQETAGKPVANIPGPRPHQSKHVFLIGLLCALAGGSVGYLLAQPQERPNALLLSPDDNRRAVLVEKRPSFAAVDRNFDVRVEECISGRWVRKVEFHSPDEGLPTGSERFIWTADSRYLLLIGKHFFADKPEASLPDGEQLYLLVDCSTGEVRCNASQSRCRRFTLADIQPLGFACFRVTAP